MPATPLTYHSVRGCCVSLRRAALGARSGGADDGAHVFAAQGLGDVAGGAAVDDLDLLDVLGVGHELQHGGVDRQRRQVFGQQVGGGDLPDELRVAAAGRVRGEDAVDVLDVGRAVGAVRVGEQERP